MVDEMITVSMVLSTELEVFFKSYLVTMVNEVIMVSMVLRTESENIF